MAKNGKKPMSSQMRRVLGVINAENAADGARRVWKPPPEPHPEGEFRGRQ